METKYIPVEFDGDFFELAGFYCPNCSAEILFSEEVIRFLRSLTIQEKPPTYLR